LIEDLLAVRDEEERVDLACAQELLVVECCDERLARPGDGDDEVPRPAGGARVLELPQDGLLPLLRLEVEREEVGRALGLGERTNEA
jgi:hypothetical protein